MNTLHNWLRELHEWLDDLERSELSIHSLVDAPTPKERVQALNHWSEVGGIMVMGYDMFVLKSLISYTARAGYKTLLLAVYKTSLFFGGSEVVGYKTSLFFEVPKWLSIKPYFFLKAKFAKGLFPDLVVYKT